MTDAKKKTNLNAATLEELTGLPSSNRVLARRILSRRVNQGPFGDFAELTQVRGVTPALAEQWAEVAIVGSGEKAPERLAAAAWTATYQERQAAGAVEPIIFAGKANLLQAVLPLGRFGLTAWQPARFNMSQVGLKTASGQMLDRVVFHPGPGFGNIPAMLATVALDPLTPPGRYEGVLSAGGQDCPAVFLVTEICSVRFDPNRFCFCELPGTEVSRSVRIANAGNTTATIAEGHVVALLQDVFWCRKGREAVRNPRLDKPHVTWDEVVSVAVHELRDAFQEEPPLRLYFSGGPLRIQPGAAHEALMTFQVPAQLRPNRRYFGVVRVFNTTFSLEFYHVRPEIEVPAEVPEEVPSPPAAKAVAKKKKAAPRPRKKR